MIKFFLSLAHKLLDLFLEPSRKAQEAFEKDWDRMCEEDEELDD